MHPPSLDCITRRGNQDYQAATRYRLLYISCADVCSLSRTKWQTPTPRKAMNLSSLVHAGIHQRQQQCSSYAPRPQQIMTSSLMANQYAGGDRPHTSYTYVTAPQPPPSPPVDETLKCSLPSISSLLGGIPNDSSSQEDAQPQASRQRGMECYHFL